MRVACVRCASIMIEGKEPIVYRVCCPCAGKECVNEIEEVEHEADDRPETFNPFTGHVGFKVTAYHIYTLKCKVCGMVSHPEPDEECDCDGEDDSDGREYELE